MIEKYDNGDWEEFELVNGKKQGKAIYHYSEKNELSREYEIRNYVDGICQGKAVLYWTGEFEGDYEERNYTDNLVQGKAIYYYSKNEGYIEYNYINGKRQGKAISYMKNGDKEEFCCIDGIRQGKTIGYCINGDKEEFCCIDGIRQGKSVYYFTDGTKEERYYIDGVLQGKSIWYFADGNKEETNYVDEVFQGKSVYYFANGDKEEANYIDGILQGNSIYYFANGNKEEEYYIDGKKYKFKFTSEHNEKFIKCEEEDHTYWLYFDNNMQRITKKFAEYKDNGKNTINSLQEKYYANGNLSLKFIDYKKDVDTEIDSMTEEYFENGKLSLKDIHYKDNGINKIKSIYENYYESDKLKTRRIEYYNYKDDEGNELIEIREDYYLNGNLKAKKREYKNIVNFENINPNLNKDYVKIIDEDFDSNGILISVLGLSGYGSSTSFSQKITYNNLGEITFIETQLKDKEKHYFENGKLKKSVFEKYINGDWEEYKVIFYDEKGNKEETNYEIEEKKKGGFGNIFNIFMNRASKKIKEADVKETLININSALEKYKK